MAKPKKIKNFVAILKDKVSLFKATLLTTTKRTTSLHVAVLRATTHDPSYPPPDYTVVDDILALGHHHSLNAGALVHALIRRVHHTSSAYVALKCLLTFHHVISRGSHLLNDQIISEGPLFSLSKFRDQSDADTWEISNWVRWYADVLDQKMCLTSLKSLNMLTNMVEKISGSPDSLHYQRINLVYEVMKLIGEDYRIIMREIYTKVEDFGTRIESFDEDSLEMFLGDLRKIEECKNKLLMMFLNKKKNDGVWELIEKVRKDVERGKKRRERVKMVEFQGSESTRGMSRVNESRSIVVVPATRGRRWLDVDWNTLVVSSNA